MISVREALDCVLRQLPRVPAEQVALTRAGGRVLADAVRAGRDVPPFRNSAMDGFAVRGGDVAGAAPDRPARLRILETVAAGAVPAYAIAPGTATRIMTGALVPDGADTVVRVEDTSETATEVAINVAPAPGANVREAGEDVRTGALVLTPGRTLRPADIGLLASVGLAMVRVASRPRVAILTTGDELVDLGQSLAPGQIANSNAYALAAAVAEAGAEPVVLGIVRDQPELIRAAFEEAFRCDVVLSTGGVSVGNFDFVRRILAELGYVESFWKVAQKPGKPLTFGVRAETPVFGLPGNPVSTLVCFYLYVVPALRAMMGCEALFLPSAQATMAETVRKASGLTEFVRCSLEGPPDRYLARSTGTQSSGVLRSMSLGDALVVGPAEARVLEQGAPVTAILLAAGACAAAAPF